MRISLNVLLPVIAVVWAVLIIWFFLNLAAPCLPQPLYLNPEYRDFREYRFRALAPALLPVFFSFLSYSRNASGKRLRVQLFVAAIIVSGLAALICYLRMQDLYQSTCTSYPPLF